MARQVKGPSALRKCPLFNETPWASKEGYPRTKARIAGVDVVVGAVRFDWDI